MGYRKEPSYWKALAGSFVLSMILVPMMGNADNGEFVVRLAIGTIMLSLVFQGVAESAYKAGHHNGMIDGMGQKRAKENGLL